MFGVPEKNNPVTVSLDVVWQVIGKIDARISEIAWKDALSKQGAGRAPAIQSILR